MFENNELKERIRTGLLSFPVTPFDADGNFAPKPFAAHLEMAVGLSRRRVDLAGGTGEMFSLTPAEIVEVVRTAKEAQPNEPIIAGCGYGTRMACELRRGLRQRVAMVIFCYRIT